MTEISEVHIDRRGGSGRRGHVVTVLLCRGFPFLIVHSASLYLFILAQTWHRTLLPGLRGKLSDTWCIIETLG